jgi:ADP-ribose pyrophosphatase YjhB (NUDIX family)
MTHPVTYPVWVDGAWLDVPVPEMSGEAIVVPNVNAIVLSPARDAILLQRRDKPGEPVRGKLEVPGGRWRAGEPPEDAVVREVKEETGLDIVELVSDTGRLELAGNRAIGYVHPVAVVNGVGGSYPSLHVLFECVATGEPVAQPGETADPRWWPVDEVERLLGDDPDEFVDQTRGMLTVYFAVTADRRSGPRCPEGHRP